MKKLNREKKMDWPKNWDARESEYYKHHMPYEDEYCQECLFIDDNCICNKDEEDETTGS